MNSFIDADRAHSEQPPSESASTAPLPMARSEGPGGRVAVAVSRQQTVEALDRAFPLARDARWTLRALARLLVRGSPLRVAELARALAWSPQRVQAALAALPACERADDGDIVGAGISLRRGVHALAIGGRRLFAARTVDLLILPGILERAFEVASVCTATGARIRVRVTPLGLRDCEPAGAVAFVPATARGLPADARLFHSKAAAEPWISVGPRGALLPMKRAFEIGVEVGRRFSVEPPGAR
jgi:hypothetical protein